MKKILGKILCGLIIIIFILQFHIMVYANEITNLQNQQSSNEEKIKDAESQKEQVSQEKSEVLQQVETIENEIADYEYQITELEGKIANLNNQITDAEDKINKKQEDYSAQKELLEKRLVVTYESGETSFLDVLLSSKSLTDLISNYYMVSQIAEADMKLMENIENEKKEIEEAKTNLEQNKNELKSSKSEMENMSIQLQSAKEEKNTYVAQLSSEEQQLQQQIDELDEANKAIDSQILAAEARIAAAKAAAEAAQAEANKNSGSASSNGSSGSGSSTSSGTASGSANLNSTSSSGFIMPVPSSYAKITTGMYYSTGQYHGAVDFGASGINGQPVFAVADGTVIIAQALTSSYGNYVLIKHDNGLYTLYAHGQAGSITVSEGTRVVQGQQIMRVGSTGNSTGPHLHFEVRTSSSYSSRVNPLNYLP